MAAAALGDAVMVLCAAMLSGTIYDHGRDPHSDLVLGLTVATLFVVPNLLTRRYNFASYLSFKRHARPALEIWVVAVGCALVLAFLTKTSESFSRGASGLMFGLGYVYILAMRLCLVQIVSRKAGARQITARHIFLVGDEGMIRHFNARHDTDQLGLRLVGASVLRPGPDNLEDDLALAAASARVLRPDDIYIMVPWTEREMLEACVDTFLRLPAAIHLAPEHFFDKFDDLHVVRTGPIASIHLVRRPLSPGDVVVKRLFDIGVATVALILLAPVLAGVAVAIRLDSRGPILFRQRRYGFNQEPFRILKFRTMHTLEDTAQLRQACAGDPRITRVGRWLRRSNIDELPQLVNVLKGEMSLVGPRPHALAHDQAFERDVALYARRHNVRPGITGWAQVNGWRGETDTPEKVQARVRHDLYYIDNWSVLFDLTILLRTIFSAKAYRNAG